MTLPQCFLIRRIPSRRMVRSVEGLVRPRANWRFFERRFPSTVAGAHEYITTFVLVDLASGASSLLIDAPSSPYVTSVVWAPDRAGQ